MSEILICNQPMKADFLSTTCGIDTSFIHGKSCSKPSALSAFTPYVLGQDLSAFDMWLISTLSAPKVANDLTNLSLSFGGDNTVALSEMTKKLQEYNVGLMGASTSFYANRLGLPFTHNPQHHNKGSPIVYQGVADTHVLHGSIALP